MNKHAYRHWIQRRIFSHDQSVFQIGLLAIMHYKFWRQRQCESLSNLLWKNLPYGRSVRSTSSSLNSLPTGPAIYLPEAARCYIHHRMPWHLTSLGYGCMTPHQFVLYLADLGSLILSVPSIIHCRHTALLLPAMTVSSGNIG